jgi:MFS family permease
MQSVEHSVKPATGPVVLAGFCAFLNLFLTQPILPLLASVFHASKAAVSLTVTAATVGVAMAAPFAGQIADRIGRRRVITWSVLILALTTLLSASATSLPELIFWRFLQGLATPGVFAVTIAYINDEWPAGSAAAAVAAYVGGTVLGGFTGRLMSGFATEFLNWRWSFILAGFADLAIAFVLLRHLPSERRFVRGAHRQLLGPAFSHLRNPRLLTTYTGGFCVLFSLIALFTYVTFHLAAPPYNLSPGQLGAIFTVYLVGAAVTPIAGRAIDRIGHRRAALLASLVVIAGALITLASGVPAILLGLTIGSSAIFLEQSAATSYIGTVAAEARALAVGIYVMFYYAGGSFGASAPAWLWDRYGWPGCIALIACIQFIFAVFVWFGWRRLTQHAPE